jgi:peptidoglycan-associated lipoprotein
MWRSDTTFQTGTRLAPLGAMKTIRPLLPLIILMLLAGCQTAKAPSDPAGAMRDLEASTTVAAIEPPDADAPSARGLPPPPEQFVPVPRLADIHFDYDAYTIRPEDTSILDENAAWIRANPGGLVLIEGHADERGTDDYNLGLGDLRAAAAKNYLIAHGIPTERMVAISYGRERPVCTEHSEACWARNRRARFLVKPL